MNNTTKTTIKMSTDHTNTNARRSMSIAKPALPPKPKISLAEKLDSKSSSLCTNESNFSNFNLIISSLKEKLNENLLNSPNSMLDSNDFSLLDEIYAEIEDKHLLTSCKSKTTNPQSSCSCSTSSTCSSCSSYSSSSSHNSDIQHSTCKSPPPLPSVPPPPINQTSSSDNRLSLSLEEEIEIEIRAKLNKDLFIRRPNPTETKLEENLVISNSEPESSAPAPILEPEYLEPILLQENKKQNCSETKLSEKSLSKLLLNSKETVLSPSKLKSYSSKAPSLSYLLKSNKLTSTLRLIRTKSSAQNQLVPTPTSPISADITKEISRPTLISQTFDLSKQNLIEIQTPNGTYSCSSYSSTDSSNNSTTSSPSLNQKYQPVLITSQPDDDDDDEDDDDSFTDECEPELSSRKSLFSSPTIEPNTIITNIYEENGRDVCLRE